MVIHNFYGKDTKIIQIHSRIIITFAVKFVLRVLDDNVLFQANLKFYLLNY